MTPRDAQDLHHVPPLRGRHLAPGPKPEQFAEHGVFWALEDKAFSGADLERAPYPVFVKSGLRFSPKAAIPSRAAAVQALAAKAA